MRLISVALAAVLATGCASQPVSVSPPTVNLSGYPPEFRQGYADGCTSAKPDAARKRDEVRFKADANYAMGWQDGYSICKSR